MDAEAFLASAGQSVVAPHRVIVRLFSKDKGGPLQECPAVLQFVPDSDRLRAIDAAADILARVPGGATPDRRAVEEAHHVLTYALRDADQPARVFFKSVEQCKQFLVEDEALRLWNEYERFKVTHYPGSISVDEVKAIKEAAQTLFLDGLISRFGYWPILRALPSLAVIYGAPLRAP